MFDGQVNADDAVFDLAASAAVLPLHAGGFVPLLGHGSLVDQADDAQIVVGPFSGSRQVLGDDAALQALQQGILIPGVMGEEFLSVRTAQPAARAIGSTLLRARSLSNPRQ